METYFQKVLYIFSFSFLMVTPNTGSLVRRGFTLIELIIVVTILAILATIAFTQFGSVSGTARDTKRRSDLSQIRDAITKKDSLESYTLSSFVSPLVATTVT
jgi:prepilin-type N-terminal cleavage/methylation domain-containing protein